MSYNCKVMLCIFYVNLPSYYWRLLILFSSPMILSLSTYIYVVLGVRMGLWLGEPSLSLFFGDSLSNSNSLTGELLFEYFFYFPIFVCCSSAIFLFNLSISLWYFHLISSISVWTFYCAFFSILLHSLFIASI